MSKKLWIKKLNPPSSRITFYGARAGGAGAKTTRNFPGCSKGGMPGVSGSQSGCGFPVPGFDVGSFWFFMLRLFWFYGN